MAKVNDSPKTWFFLFFFIFSPQGGGGIFARHKWQVTLITILNSPINVGQNDFLEFMLIFIIRSNAGHINVQSTLNL